MSRQVINRLVIPILHKIAGPDLAVTPHFESWLEERLKLYLSACRAVDECKQLEERLQQLRREDLAMCPSCRVLNSLESPQCYGCGCEPADKPIQLELSRGQARFLRALLNIFWTTFNTWSPFAKLADDYPGCDLIVLADQLTRKLEHLLGER